MIFKPSAPGIKDILSLYNYNLILKSSLTQIKFSNIPSN